MRKHWLIMNMLENREMINKNQSLSQKHLIICKDFKRSFARMMEQRRYKIYLTNRLTGGTIFLIFNSTHVATNIYDNFWTRLLQLPSLLPVVTDSKKT